MARIKILILLFLTAAFISGCSKCPSGTKAAEVVVSINNYDITRDEFETLFRESAYGKSDTPESRREFLGNLIDRKLILQYAQKEGLDREGAFLKMIESFWEQSLLKVALDRKNREIDAKLSASGWQARKDEEAGMMDDWLKELRSRAVIKVKGEKI